MRGPRSRGGNVSSPWWSAGDCKVRLVAPIRWPWDMRADHADVANHAAALLHLPHRLEAGEIEMSEEFVGPAYGAVTREGWEAIDLLARTEGILLAPVYASKAMAGLGGFGIGAQVRLDPDDAYLSGPYLIWYPVSNR